MTPEEWRTVLGRAGRFAGEMALVLGILFAGFAVMWLLFALT